MEHTPPPTPLSTEPYKGVRDYYPTDMRRLKRLFAAWRRAVEAYGYEEYSASVLEPTDLYLSKSSEEIVREQTYSFVDRGDRAVTLRPEMTPTVARMLAGKCREIPLPARWYSIPNLFRYERPQRGRLREHYQLNVDIFGVEGWKAEVELILVAHRVMEELGIPDEAYVFKLNSRVALTEALRKGGFDGEVGKEVIRLIDRKDKIDDFEARLADLAPGFELDPSEPDDVRLIRERLEEQGITNVRFDPYLARGFDYYTGVVFEVFALDPENRRALFGGGRYDGMMRHFGVDPIPAAGFGMGDVTAADLMDTLGIDRDARSATQLHVCVASDVADGRLMAMVETWRDAGLRVSLDVSGKKIGDQIRYADRLGVPLITVIGQDEISSGIAIIKRLSDGTTAESPLDGVPSAVIPLLA